jgi:integrase
MAGTTRRKPGWMGMHIDGLRAWLLERGYTPGSIKHVLTLAGQLGRWREGSDVKLSHLDWATMESLLDALRARGVRRVPGPRGVRPLLDYLDSEGALAFKPVPDSPVERLVAEYRTWLVVDRGMAAPTVLRYENLARRFLGQQPAADGGQLELGDIDWRAGEIQVAGKARRRDRLPLPHDVGEALSAYLREVRPATSIRQVFLMLKARSDRRGQRHPPTHVATPDEPAADRGRDRPLACLGPRPRPVAPARQARPAARLDQPAPAHRRHRRRQVQAR